MKIIEHANECGLTRAAGKYKREFPSLRESTVCGWLNKYRSQLEAKVQSSQIVISEKRGRALYLPDELDKKLRTFITHMRMAGGTINRHVIFGVLVGLIKSDLATYGPRTVLSRRLGNSRLYFPTALVNPHSLACSIIFILSCSE